MRDAHGQALAFIYCEDEPGRRAKASCSPVTRRGASPPTDPVTTYSARSRCRRRSASRCRTRRRIWQVLTTSGSRTVGRRREQRGVLRDRSAIDGEIAARQRLERAAERRIADKVVCPRCAAEKYQRLTVEQRRIVKTGAQLVRYFSQSASWAELHRPAPPATLAQPPTLN